MGVEGAWSNQQILAFLVEIISGLPGTGLFVYNGTPALGNPPVLAIVAPGTTSDPFGNPTFAVLNIGNVSAAHAGFDDMGDFFLADATGTNRIVFIPSITAEVFYDSGGPGGNVLMSLAATGGSDAIVGGTHTIVPGVNLLQLPLYVNNPASLFTGTVNVPATALLEVVGLGSQTVDTITTPGSANFTVPAGVTALKVECWAGGGSGSPGVSGQGKGGGGGGEYAAEASYVVTPGQVIPYVVGAAGSAGGGGGNTTFNATAVVAHGGSPGVAAAGGGGGTGSTNSVHFPGGHGGVGVVGSGSLGGGGGGSSAGTAVTGNPGSAGVTSAGGAGGAAPAGGAAGGAGGNAGVNGTAGSAPGGAGGGGGSGATGANGAAGKLQITYTPASGYLLTATGTSQTDVLGNTIPAALIAGPLQAIQPSTVITAETWHSITTGFPAGWTGSISYRLLAEQQLVMAQVILSVANTTNVTFGETITSLPSGYLPSNFKTFTCNFFNGAAVTVQPFQIGTAGQLQYVGAAFAAGATAQYTGQIVYTLQV